MSEYAYKVQLTNEECFSKKFVSFHDEELLDYEDVSTQAVSRMSAHICGACGEQHDHCTYVPTDIEISRIQ